MPTGSPLDVNHYATLLRRPLRYKECVEGIYRKHMQERPDQELVFIDMGMGPEQLYKSIMLTLKDTPEWQQGQVRATASIDPVEAGDAKTKLGWARSQLERNLQKANVLMQVRQSIQGRFLFLWSPKHTLLSHKRLEWWPPTTKRSPHDHT